MRARNGRQVRAEAGAAVNQHAKQQGSGFFLQHQSLRSLACAQRGAGDQWVGRRATVVGVWLGGFVRQADDHLVGRLHQLVRGGVWLGGGDALACAHRGIVFGCVCGCRCGDGCMAVAVADGRGTIRKGKQGSLLLLSRRPCVKRREQSAPASRARPQHAVGPAPPGRSSRPDPSCSGARASTAGSGGPERNA